MVSVSPLPRRWLWLVGAISLALSVASSPGQISPDTKLDLTANPLRLLARAADLWNSDLPFGQAQNQAYGYQFPHGAFFAAGDLIATAWCDDDDARLDACRARVLGAVQLVDHAVPPPPASRVIETIR